jgi:hypothetical protein
MGLRQTLSEIYNLVMPQHKHILESWKANEIGFNEAKRRAHATHLSPAIAKQERLTRSFVRVCAGNGLTLKQMLELVRDTYNNLAAEKRLPRALSTQQATPVDSKLGKLMGKKPS